MQSVSGIAKWNKDKNLKGKSVACVYVCMCACMCVFPRSFANFSKRQLFREYTDFSVGLDACRINGYRNKESETIKLEKQDFVLMIQSQATILGLSHSIHKNDRNTMLVQKQSGCKITATLKSLHYYSALFLINFTNQKMSCSCLVYLMKECWQ